MVFVNPGKDVLLEKIRTKGIPHPSGPFPYQESIVSEVKEDTIAKLEEIQLWLENPQTYTIPKNFISKRLYVYEMFGHDSYDDGESTLTTRINFEMIQSMMARTGTLCCYMGTMKKAFLDAHGRALLIKPTVVKRVANVSDWWRKEDAPRQFREKEKDNVFALSFPRGYIQPLMQRDTNDYSSLDLLSELLDMSQFVL